MSFSWTHNFKKLCSSRQLVKNTVLDVYFHKLNHKISPVLLPHHGYDKMDWGGLLYNSQGHSDATHPCNLCKFGWQRPDKLFIPSIKMFLLYHEGTSGIVFGKIPFQFFPTGFVKYCELCRLYCSEVWKGRASCQDIEWHVRGRKGGGDNGLVHSKMLHYAYQSKGFVITSEIQIIFIYRMYNVTKSIPSLLSLQYR